MAFRPRMQAQTRAYRTLEPLRVRTWPGVVADVWHVEGGAGGGGFYLSPDPRLVVFLGTPPRKLSLSASETGGSVSDVSVLYVPAGQPLWSAMAARSGSPISTCIWRRAPCSSVWPVSCLRPNFPAW